MTAALSPELTALVDLAHQTSCAQWAQQMGWKMRRAGNELIGSCPTCGGEDRFAINLSKDVWNCRGCSVGGDVIFLVRHTENLRLKSACERITGRTAETLPSPDEQARLRLSREEEMARQERIAADYRERARREAWALWSAAAGVDLDPVAAYLTVRGLEGGTVDFTAPGWFAGMPLRLQPRRTYYHNGVELHAGPAMYAAIQSPSGRFSGLHQTWLDLDEPKGKLVLPIAEGERKPPPAKKVLGVKKRGAIRLRTPRAFTRLVMGEGIETTFTALTFEDDAHTAYWAGVDLGNMSGKAARSGSGAILHDQPDMDDRDCFVPPDHVEELVYLCDGDEPEKHTVDKVTRGLRRAQRLRDRDRLAGEGIPALKIMMVPPGEAGTDLNSLAMAGAVEVGE